MTTGVYPLQRQGRHPGVLRAVTTSLALLAASLAFASSHTAGAAPPGSQCGANLTAPQIGLAVRSLSPAIRGVDAPWDPNAYGGNFDPCATLSTALVTIQGATGSSPEHALLFHNGEYVGTATPAPYPFTSLNKDETTDDTVVLNYKDGRSVCTACPGPVYEVHYQWQGDRAAMLDPLPPSPGG
jgi:hypothetical protein